MLLKEMVVSLYDSLRRAVGNRSREGWGMGERWIWMLLVR